MASRTKRTEQIPELKASPDGCAEASSLSTNFYIPCNRPAKFVIVWTGRTDAPVRMCEMCAGHNVKNRGGYIVGYWQVPTTTVVPSHLQAALGHNSAVTDNDLIAENHELEDQIKTGLAKFNEWAKPLKDRIKAIEDDLFKRLAERGADSTKTDAGTAYISRLESVVMEDTGSLFDFAADHWDQYGAEIKLTIGIKAVRQHMDDNNGQLPPGISLSKYTRLNIKRS